MTCPSCNAAASGHFCNVCGRKLNQAAKPAESKRWAWIALGILILAVMMRSALAPGPATSAANHPEQTRPAEGAIVPAIGTAICSDTEQGFDEVAKWQSLRDYAEAARAMLRYGGAVVNKGDSVKILELGFIKQRIRVMKTGRECWVVAEAIDGRK